MYLPPLWRKIQVGVKSRGETTLGPLLRGGGGPREHGWTHRGRLRPPSRFLRSYGDAPSMRALYTISRRMVVVKAQILLVAATTTLLYICIELHVTQGLVVFRCRGFIAPQHIRPPAIRDQLLLPRTLELFVPAPRTSGRSRLRCRLPGRARRLPLIRIWASAALPL
jgi:hypothetical protein